MLKLIKSRRASRESGKVGCLLVLNVGLETGHARYLNRRKYGRVSHQLGLAKSTPSVRVKRSVSRGVPNHESEVSRNA
jgi:hypothetical protein